MLPHIVKGPLFPLSEGVSHGDDDMMDLSRPLSFLSSKSLSPPQSRNISSVVSVGGVRGALQIEEAEFSGGTSPPLPRTGMMMMEMDFAVKGPFSGEGSISKSCVCTRPRECPSAADMCWRGGFCYLS